MRNKQFQANLYLHFRNQNNFDIPLLGAIPDFENYGIANYSYNSKSNAAKGGNKDANK